MPLRITGIRGWILLAAAGVLWCQDPADPPARVARLGSMNGQVSIRPANVEEWAPATLNYPLTTGDRLWTDAESHADLHAGITAIHMAPETALAVLYLNERVAQFSLSEGAINVRIPRLDEDEIYEVDTPVGAVSLLQVGNYRIDVAPDGKLMMVTVRSGEAEVFAGGAKYQVKTGEMLRVYAGEPVIAEVVAAPQPDPWDEWCMSEDMLAERSVQASEPYVSAEMTGVEDLSMYGDWSTDSDYGYVWTPRDVGEDWAPYRYGCWVYRAPWGWTWIDEARWGFAPFHYGRWVLLGTRWVWVPGPRIVRPVWAPALVVFYKDPGTPRLSWVPLGPREAFRPPYRASGSYVRRVNPGVRNPDQVPPAYVNRGHGTAVTREIFAGGRPVGPARVRQAERELGAVRPVNSPDVQPGRESYVARRAGSVNRVVKPPERLAERPVVVRRELPAAVTPATPVAGAESRRRTAPTVAAPRTEEASHPTEARPVDSVRRQEDVQRAIDARREQERQAESVRRQEEQRRTEDARRAESQRRAEESRQADEQRRAAEEQRRAESQRRTEEQQRADEQRRAESQRRADEQRQADEQRRAESQRRVEEQQRRQEEQRQAEEARRAESQRRAEEQQRRQDEQRQAEEARRAESQRRAEEQQRRQDEQRQAEEARRAESQRRAEEQQRRQEEQRQAEEQRRAESQRRAEEQQRRQDEQRRADEQRQAESQRRAEEQQRRQEEQRRQDEQRKQDEASRADSPRKKQ